jgi:hypothetical protein
MAVTLTRAERLDRCVAALGPEMAELLKNGWGSDGAPYSIEELANGRFRIRLTDRISGDIYAGTGATMDEALTALEAKVLKPDVKPEGGA